MRSYRHLNLTTEVADCIDALGCVARIDGLFDFAIAMHGEAIRVYQEGRLQIEESIARYNLAKTLLRSGHLEGAPSEGLKATGVLGSDVDGRVVSAAALDRLGRRDKGDLLRREYADRWGDSMLEHEITWIIGSERPVQATERPDLGRTLDSTELIFSWASGEAAESTQVSR